MFEIKVSKEIKDACPVFAGAAVYAAVKNTAYNEGALAGNQRFYQATDFHYTDGRHQTSTRYLCYP